jgi:predicted flap endonuclease-1-like 5' DNA nuclease
MPTGGSSLSSDRGRPHGTKRKPQKPEAIRKKRGSPGKTGANEAIHPLTVFAATDDEVRTRPDASSVTPDDFAAALQKTVDDLQARLTSLTNPITNFAIKEFRIETPVVVSVSKLGTLNYRFLSAGETVDSSKITRLSLTIVPIEKQSSAGSLPPSLFTPEETVADLSGLDSTTVEILRQHQVHTVSDLWRIASRASARAELETMLKMDRVKLSNLLSEAELLLVRGIGSSEARILFRIGITSLSDLSKLKPEELAQKFNQAAERKDMKLQSDVAETWIKAARSYVGPSNTGVSQSPVDLPST